MKAKLNLGLSGGGCLSGAGNPRDALAKHVDDEDKRASRIATPSGEQEMTIINESGLYSLVLSSKLPGAKKFRRWVTAEVLPSIRKTGGYNVPKDYPSALRALADAEEKQIALAAENEAQKQIIADFQPIRQHVDTILASTGTMTMPPPQQKGPGTAATAPVSWGISSYGKLHFYCGRFFPQ